MNSRTFGVYIHIPFCVQKCGYCDFNSYANALDYADAYVAALVGEIAAFPHDNCACNTIFFGGGTPTLLSIEQLGAIMEAISRKFTITNDAEISIETNPGIDIDFGALKTAGFNRLSIGAQSVHNDELKLLGRIHTAEQIFETFANAQKHFDNINIDLIYGLPNQSLASWRDSVDVITKLNPQHISAYSLKIEEGTPFYANNINPAEEDVERKMYYYISENPEYHRYEISNFAKKGYKCRHNLKYWQREEYAGFGAGAHSQVGSRRYSNIKSLRGYVEAKVKVEEINDITEKEARSEKIILGLRLDNGLSGYNFNGYEKQLQESIKQGLIEQVGGNFQLTKRGIDVSNQVFLRFL